MENTDAKRLFPSRFLRVFEKDGLVALIHQLRPEPIYLPKKDWRNIISSITAGAQPKHDIVPELLIRKLKN